MQQQDSFVAARREDWDELDRLLAGDRGLRSLPGDGIARAAALYRAVCADLMRARSAGYAPDLLSLLDGLAARGHNALYSAGGYRLAAVWDFLAREFPRTLRRYWRFFGLAAVLFVLPGLVGYAGARSSRSFAVGILPAEMAEEMEKAYAEGFGAGRGEGVDTGMAGFYVYNNVGIAFRCFATGVLLGLGSIFFLVYNGLVSGAVAGVVAAAGHGGNLFTFVCGHSVFELTAVIVAGAAGMVMGHALVDTGGLSRWRSLRRRAPDLAVLVLGAAVMLLVAAGIEAFWSPSSVPGVVKRVVAGVLAVLLGVYFTCAGRSRLGPQPAPAREGIAP
jgi:uncharacterized membrane protein SpoIIM required for sporulation